MGRPRKFTERDVVSTAADVFTANGLAATTLDDLVRATGLGKQSLYNAFGGKRELFLRALSEDHEVAARAVSEALEHGDATPLERIRGHMLRIAIQLSDPEAHVSLTTRALIEAGSEEHDLAAANRHGIEHLAGVYAVCLEAARVHGDLPDGTTVPGLAMYFVVVTQGMEVLARAGVGRAVLTAVALDSVRVFLPAGDGTALDPTRADRRPRVDDVA